MSQRISRQEALDLFKADLHEIGLRADAIRKEKHPDNVVSYIIDRNINYTNLCNAYCTFCAFYRPPGDTEEGYTLPNEVIFKKIEETIELGGTGILLQGGDNPDLPIEYYENLLREMKRRYKIHAHCFSAPELVNLANVANLSIEDTLKRLRDAGLDSIPGGGAEILDDAVRKRISPLKCTTEEWLNVHRTAHRLGLRTTATMMFGCGETLEHRLNHFERIRNLQDEYGGFTAFISWPFQPDNTPLGKKHSRKTTAVEYLMNQAVSRIFLDNIDNIQSSWVTMGLGTGQVGLYFGANDVGSIMIEENVVSAAGTTYRTTERELRHMISAAGFIPMQRTTLYTMKADSLHGVGQILIPVGASSTPAEQIVNA
ncbi:MAG: dehypoxanthine futalosine cyclase [Acidobacteriia bacterium]|nr:dehypoxanthine futalosine cyclase [Terriglobia bacterium]